MNAKHRKTLEAIFSRPTPKALPFRNIESLLRAIGCETIEGAGSRVLFSLGGIDWTTHRPHPDKVARLYHIREVRDFLAQLGVKP